MAQLRQDYNQFRERGAEVVVLGPENATAFAKYWAANDLPFIGLPDPELAVLRQYGQEVKILRLGRMPAQILIDKRRTARFAHYGHGMSDIPPNAEILGLLERLNAE